MRSSTAVERPVSYPSAWPPVLMHHFLLAAAERGPHDTAVIAPGRRWTYRDLVESSTAYADQLWDAGLRPADIVTVAVEPAPEAVALLCALSSIGAVYVPLNTDYPQARQQRIMDSTQPKLHIVMPHDARRPRGVPLIGQVSEAGLTLDAALSATQRRRAGPVLESDVAYVIFTSGTTGTPKGIMMSHRAILTFWRAAVAHCRLTTSDRVATVAPLGFDLSVIDMGIALGSGAALVQMPRALLAKPSAFIDLLREQRVTQVNSVPSVWRLLLRHAAPEVRELLDLRAAFYAGEAFLMDDLHRLRQCLPQLRVINCFGHTESMCCTFEDIPVSLSPEAREVPIGVAHPGAELLLVDESGAEVSEPGVVGEMYLRGGNLFAGYWADADATRAALVRDPLDPTRPEPVFRTRDLARLGADGKLYYSGRADLQIQVRGMRVEAEEIERILARHPRVAAAVVTVNGPEDDGRLVAHIVPADADAPALSELRAFARTELPNYMLPAQLHVLREFPTGHNGKIDRVALAAQHGGN